MDDRRTTHPRTLQEIEERLDQLDLLGLHGLGAEGEYAGLAKFIAARFLRGLRGEPLMNDAALFIWEEYEMRPSWKRLQLLGEDLERGGILRTKLDRL